LEVTERVAGRENREIGRKKEGKNERKERRKERKKGIKREEGGEVAAWPGQPASILSWEARQSGTVGRHRAARAEGGGEMMAQV